MNWSVGKISTVNQRSPHANGMSTPPIGCVLDLPGLPGAGNKIYDRSPYGNIGTITGATWKRLPSGLWYLDFDGVDDKVTVAHNSSLSITNNLTLIIWLKVSEAQAYDDALICKGVHLAPNLNYEMIFRGTAIRFASDFGAGLDSVNLGINYQSYYDQWIFLAVTYCDPTVACYFNGVFQRSESHAGGLGTNSNSLYLGQEGGNSHKMAGSLILPRIYNRALSALEMQNHFNREKHLFGVW